MKSRCTVVICAWLLWVSVPAGAEDCLERVGRAPHGVAEAVVAEGNRAYVGNGAELTIIALGDPSNPSAPSRGFRTTS